MNGEPGRSKSIAGQPQSPLLIVLSGPSGVGKDAVLTRLRESGYPLRYITTLTTRLQRPNEKDGVDYHFVSEAKFQEMLDGNALIESANVYGNWYGVPRSAVKEALDRGEDVIIKIDVQGAATIRRIAPRAVFIFLTAPLIKELSNRLEQRLTESPDQLTVRLRTAEEEMKQLHLFDYVVVNHEGEIDAAVSRIEAIINAEKCRVNPRQIELS
ncbi:MAG: guanylate kinase [Dehalococcoidales bacterium]|nr:guanylate kinase [Dehalococcoidales bacterium]